MLRSQASSSYTTPVGLAAGVALGVAAVAVGKGRADAGPVQAGGVQHGGMTGAVADDNRSLTTHRVKIGAGRMAFFGQPELVIAVAAQPLTGLQAEADVSPDGAATQEST